MKTTTYNGYVKYRYSSGEIKFKGFYRDGKKNGKWVDGHEVHYKENPNAKVIFK